MPVPRNETVVDCGLQWGHFYNGKTMVSLRLPVAPARAAVARRPIRVIVPRASRVAEPASITVKSSSTGDDKGSASLALKVADPKTAKSVVHRYLVMVRQNARQVCDVSALDGHGRVTC